MTTSSRTTALTVAAAVATLSASAVLLPLFDSLAWLPPTLVTVAAVAAAGWCARALRLPVVLHPILSGLVLLTVLTWMFARSAAFAGFLPGPAAIGELRTLVQTAMLAAEELVPPVPTEPPMTILAVGGIGLMALAVDIIAVTLRLPALAGIPLLVLYSVPAAILRGGVAWWLLPLAVVGWLALLAVDARTGTRGWGPILTLRRADRPASRSEPRLGSGAAVALRGGLAALALAVVVPAVIPGLGEPVWGSGRGPAIGGETPADGPVAFDPFVSLRRDLVSNTERELFRYTTDDPNPSYLRLTTLSEFDGVTWRPEEAQVRIPATETLPPPITTGSTSGQTYEFRIGDLDNAQLPLPYAATSIVGVDGALDPAWSWDPLTRTVEGSGVTSLGQSYAVAVTDVQPTRAELRQAERRASDDVLRFTQLPDSITPELGQLAEQITANATTPYAKAIALERWFTQDGGFVYSTSVTSTPDVDPLTEFLDQRIGYCEQFSATMALMARSLGIPARVNVGFTAGRQLDDGTWQVQARHAHAWPELWFSGVGWVWFEPTPRGEPDAGIVAPPYSQTPNDPSSRTPETDLPADRLPGGLPPQDAAAGAPGALSPQTQSSTNWPVIMAVLALLALLVTPATLVALRRRRRLSQVDPRSRIEGAWLDMADSVSDLGWTWPSAASPRAAARWLAGEFRLEGETRSGLARLTWWVEQVRYAPPGGRIDAPDPATLRADLARIRAAMRRITTRPRVLRAWLAPASLRRAARASERAGEWAMSDPDDLADVGARARTSDRMAAGGSRP